MTDAKRKSSQVRVSSSGSPYSSQQQHHFILVHMSREEPHMEILEAWVLVVAELVACCLLLLGRGVGFMSQAGLISSPCIVPQTSCSH